MLYINFCILRAPLCGARFSMRPLTDLFFKKSVRGFVRFFAYARPILPRRTGGVSAGSISKRVGSSCVSYDGLSSETVLRRLPSLTLGAHCKTCLTSVQDDLTKIVLSLFFRTYLFFEIPLLINNTYLWGFSLSKNFIIGFEIPARSLSTGRPPWGGRGVGGEA